MYIKTCWNKNRDMKQNKYKKSKQKTPFCLKYDTNFEYNNRILCDVQLSIEQGEKKKFPWQTVCFYLHLQFFPLKIKKKMLHFNKLSSNSEKVKKKSTKDYCYTGAHTGMNHLSMVRHKNYSIFPPIKFWNETLLSRFYLQFKKVIKTTFKY